MADVATVTVSDFIPPDRLVLSDGRELSVFFDEDRVPSYTLPDPLILEGGEADPQRLARHAVAVAPLERRGDAARQRRQVHAAGAVQGDAAGCTVQGEPGIRYLKKWQSKSL